MIAAPAIAAATVGGPAAVLKLPVRFYRVGTALDQPCVEEGFHYVERTFMLPLAQTALVLVDVWDMHYVASHFQRATGITHDFLVPALMAARRAGLTVVHAPSPPVAKRYPQWTRYAADQDLWPVSGPAPDWPPADFRARRGEFAEYGRDQEPHIEAWRKPYERMMIAPAVEPLPDEYVIATGGQLHRLLRDQGILHLVYVGFATNMCVPGRDYGMKAMRDRGYNPVLLRDCTTAIEFHDTVSDQLATKLWTRDLELQGSCFSATSADFRTACATV